MSGRGKDSEDPQSQWWVCRTDVEVLLSGSKSMDVFISLVVQVYGNVWSASCAKQVLLKVGMFTQ